jgi:hypothetical protein
MAPSEQTAINELTDEVRGLRADLRVFHTKMFGDDTQENERGRIPIIEATLEDHRLRIGAIESVRERGKGVAWLAALIVGGIDLAYHAATIFGIVRK